MHKWSKAPLALVLVLAGCDGNPFVAGDETGGGSTVDDNAVTIDSEVSKDVTDVSYSKGTLKLSITGVTSDTDMATFTRDATRDIDGTNGGPDLKAYTFQQGGGSRYYLAYVATNTNKSVVAVATADGGQFNEHNGGGQVYRVSTYSKPTDSDGAASGYFRYAGSYAGVFVPGSAVDVDENPGLRPNEPLHVSGSIVMNASFSSNLVEGGIVDRKLFTQDGTQLNTITIGSGTDATTYDLTGSTPATDDDWTDLVLRETKIDSNGTFLGTVEYRGSPDTEKGKFAGAFGGEGATDLAGVLWVHPLQDQDGVWEYGAFNLPVCADATTEPVCLLDIP